MTAQKKIILAGNPNVGKSLIFNNLTGAHQRIGNYPGVTVTHYTGHYTHNEVEIDVTDLPGLYSFNSGYIEEAVAHEFLLQNNADLIINIIDGRKLERNLFLTVKFS